MSRASRWSRRLVGAALALAVLPAAGAAQLQGFGAELAPELPGATGTGSVLAIYNPATFGLKVFANWSGLSGTTTVSHFHCCVAPPGTVGVAVTPGTLPGFPAGLMAGSYQSPVIDLNDPASFTADFLNNFGGGTVEGARAAFLAGAANGTNYFNIHTSTFPRGEIRGFLSPTAVPEPSTYALMATGLGVVGMVGWRRRRS
jgi:hypothetical protein